MPVTLRGSLAHFPPAQLLTLLGANKHVGELEVAGEGRDPVRLFFRDGSVLAAEDVVLELFTREAGEFTFRDDAQAPADAAPVAYALLVEKGLAHARESRVDAKARFRVVDDPPENAAINLTAEEFKVLMRVGSGKAVADIAAEAKLKVEETQATLLKLESAGLVARVVRPSTGTAPVPVAVEQHDAPTIRGHQQPPAPRKTIEKATPVKAPKRIHGSLTASGTNAAVYPLLDDEQSIGRTDANAICFSDASVSSRHARILRTDEGFVLEDLGSRNGTWVNGEKVTAPRLLVDKDLVRFGKIVVTYNTAIERRKLETTQ
ncbi:MAG TPA: FHA domain-containing protein, partial [Thermoanaerobaculia bacterium]